MSRVENDHVLPPSAEDISPPVAPYSQPPVCSKLSSAWLSVMEIFSQPVNFLVIVQSVSYTRERTVRGSGGTSTRCTLDRDVEDVSVLTFACSDVSDDLSSPILETYLSTRWTLGCH